MKIYDIVIATKGKEGKTFWRTIGSVFASDESHLMNSNNKPAGFTIDYPQCSGIVVARKAKKDAPS